MRKKIATKKRVRRAALAVPPEEKAKMAGELAEFSTLFRGLENRKQRAFLMGYVRTLGIRSAMRLSGVCSPDHYFLLKTVRRYREVFVDDGRMLTTQLVV